MIVIPQEAHVLLEYKKGKALFHTCFQHTKKERHCFLFFIFFHHRILVEAAHVRKILLVKLGLLQKDTVVSVHKDSGERIVTKVFCSFFIK